MAILGSHYFSAQNGSVTSSEALSNPFNSYMTLESNDLLNIPFLENVIADAHYESPNRKGRHTAFLARMTQMINGRSFGIASNEYVAVCFGDDGKAFVYGDYPNYQEFAYFLQSNCQANFSPENMQSGTPLTWNKNGQAVKVYKVTGTMNGENYFDLSDWQTGSGGSWENWSVNNGIFASVSGTQNTCTLYLQDFQIIETKVSPVPFKNELRIKTSGNSSFEIYDIQGRLMAQNSFSEEIKVNTEHL